MSIESLNSLTLYSLFKGRLSKTRDLLPEEEELFNVSNSITFEKDDEMNHLMAIDVISGVTIIYYHKDVLGLDYEAIRSLIIHELSHVLRGDTLIEATELLKSGLSDDIKPYFDEKVIGVIEDHVINESLYELDKIKYKYLYENGIILTKQDVIINWSSKEIVDYLDDFLEKGILNQSGEHKETIITDICFKNTGDYIKFQPPENGENGGSDSNEEENDSESSKNSANPIKKSGKSIKKHEKEMKSLINLSLSDAETLLDGLGSGSGAEMETLAEIKEPIEINWESVLAGYLSDIISFKDTDESWAYPNYFDDDEIGEVWENLSIINLVVDTSGSMYSQKILDAILEIIVGLGEMVVRIIQIDTEVKEDNIIIMNTEELKSDGTLPVVGGGATTLSPAFAYIHEQEWDLNPTIVITDGYIEAGDYKPLLDNRFWVIINGTTSKLPKNENFEVVKI